ncbi:MAG: ribbon-helix-helix domain-containing protein [Candidatus Sulfotelmatobacter sp.]
MPETELARLTIVWSKDTDLALRSYLGAQGLKKGALSKFVEDAVRWRLFDHTVSQVRQAFADVSADDLRDMINEAVASARKDKRRQPKRRVRRKQ